jgi:hypothetical protein
VAENTPIDVVVSLGAAATAYEVWTTDPGGSFLGTLADRSTVSDSDGGGLSNGIEWVVGGDPTDGGDDAGRAPICDHSSPDKLVFRFRRRDIAHADADTMITVQYGAGLGDWDDAVHGTDGVLMDDAAVPEAGFHAVVVSIPKTLAGPGGALFARVRVTTTR